MRCGVVHCSGCGVERGGTGWCSTCYEFVATVSVPLRAHGLTWTNQPSRDLRAARGTGLSPRTAHVADFDKDRAYTQSRAADRDMNGLRALRQRKGALQSGVLPAGEDAFRRPHFHVAQCAPPADDVRHGLSIVVGNIQGRNRSGLTSRGRCAGSGRAKRSTQSALDSAGTRPCALSPRRPSQIRPGRWRTSPLRSAPPMPQRCQPRGR